MSRITTIPATRPFHGDTAPKVNAAIPKKRVATYCRVSTDTDEQATSYEEQVNHYTERIKSEAGWELAGVFTDVYNQRLIPFDTKMTINTIKITAFEGKIACRKPLFLFFEVMQFGCWIHQCTQAN